MPSTEPVRREVPIALVYQAQGLHEHLEQALTDLGARVVYHAVAASFDRSALVASGARVVVINLDPEVEEEFSAFDELLEDDRLHVVFNDAEVSSRLQGYDQARWARHLAAKILGRGELNPPRPPGAEAVPVRVKPKAPEYEGSTTPDLRFQLEGGELAAALAADTDESVRRTRAALVTADEPVAAERIDPFTGNATSRHDAPTVVLRTDDVAQALQSATARHDAPTPELDAGSLQVPSRHDAPTLELDADGLQAPSRHDAPTVRLRLDDVRGAAAPAELPAFTEDFLPDAAAPAGAGADDDPFGDLEGLSLEELTTEPAPTDAKPASDAGFDLDPDFAESLRDFGLLGDGAPSTARDAADEAPADADAGSMALTDEFGEALGALSLAPLDEDDGPSQKEAPVAGLDDLLLDLPSAGEPTSPPPAVSRTPPVAKTAPGATRAAPPPAPAKTPPPPKAVPSIDHLSLADDAEDAPAPAPAPPPPPAAAARRSLDDFDFSGLSLAPLGDEEQDSTPVTGRAQFQIDDKDRRAAPPPAEAPSVAPAPVAAADDAGDALEFDLRGLRTPEVDPSIAAELAAMAAAADALPLGKPVIHGVRNVWVLGASIGGPEAVREFLAGVPADVPAVFLLAQHMGADFLDLMVQQLARATTLPVRTVVDGDLARHGEVIVVPLVDRLQLDDTGRISVTGVADNSPYSPSIDRVMRDVADQFGRSAGAIVFSGMASDAIEGSVYLRERGGTVWVQDPGTCVISSMVDGAQDAGVVSFVGSPAELAREFVAELSRRAARA